MCAVCIWFTCDKVSSVLPLPSVGNLPFKNVVGEEEELVFKKKKSSILLSEKQQCAVWDNTAHIKMSSSQNRCSALKCTNGRRRLGKQLLSGGSTGQSDTSGLFPNSPHKHHLLLQPAAQHTSQYSTTEYRSFFFN